MKCPNCGSKVVFAGFDGLDDSHVLRCQAAVENGYELSRIAKGCSKTGVWKPYHTAVSDTSKCAWGIYYWQGSVADSLETILQAALDQTEIELIPE